jgi:hypothetical protein
VIRLIISKREEENKVQASWKVAGIFKADASRVAEEITNLGKECTTKDIVNVARNSSSELHKCFEWDDTVAGEKYREIQAQQILRSLVISKQVENKDPVTYRLFVNTGDRDGKYKPVEVVVKQKDEYEKLLETAKRELQAFKDKYSILVELNDLFNEIDKL